MAASTAYVGRSVPRRDGREKVTGLARYGADLAETGMLHGRVLRSPVPHARLARLDASAALQVPGVVAVLTRDDIRRWGISPVFGSLVKDQPIVAVDRVRYVGDAVAAVAAETEAAAEEALDRIDVAYEDLPAAMTIEEALAPGAPLLHDGAAGNVSGTFRLRRGDVAAGLAAADLVLEHTFTLPPVSHAALEPFAVLATWLPDGAVDVWTSTQTPSAVRQDLADVFHLPLSRVRVRVPLLGGGFGCKCYLKVEPVAVALARCAGRPVRLVLPQDECFLTVTRHGARIRVASGLTRSGDILARRMDVQYDAGAYADVSPRVTRNGGYPGAGPYRIPNVWVDASSVFTNKVPAGAYRGYGVTQVCWAVESHTDLLAAAVGLDPLEFRIRNAWRDGDTSHNGQVVHGLPMAEVVQAAAAAVDWPADRGRAPDAPRVAAAGFSHGGSAGSPAPDPAAAARPSVRRGKGLAMSVKGTSPSLSNAELKMNEDGSLDVVVGTVEMGQGSETSLAQIAADALAVPLEAVRVVRPDTAVTPYDRSTSSSRSVYMMGNAILGAATEVRQQLLEAAAEQLEASPADLELDDGSVAVRGSPERRLSYARIIAGRYGGRAGSLMGRGAAERTGGMDPATGQGHQTPFWECTAAACEVEVDTDTGRVTVLRYAAAVDCGTVVNPVLCEGQVEGGVTHGFGPALGEELRFDGGQPLNPHLVDYPVPAAGDMPAELRAVLLQHPAPDGPFGAHGVGEAAVMPVAPAIANAVADAVGVRIHDLPLTPEKVLAAIRDGAQR